MKTITNKYIDCFTQERDGRLWRVFVFENSENLEEFYMALSGRTLEQKAWFEEDVQKGMVLLWTLYDPYVLISGA